MKTVQPMGRTSKVKALLLASSQRLKYPVPKSEYFMLYEHHMKFKFVSIHEVALGHRHAHIHLHIEVVSCNIMYFSVTMVELNNVAHKSLKYLLPGPVQIESANPC